MNYVNQNNNADKNDNLQKSFKLYRCTFNINYLKYNNFNIYINFKYLQI